MNKRLLLCRPQGGLNDMLCQIEKCCRYAELVGRTVIVDTAYTNSEYFRDNFDRYFSTRQKKLVLSYDYYSTDTQTMQVFPESLQGRLNTYEAQFERSKKAFCDTKTGQPTTFDFKRNYPHALLVHHQAGGGNLSQFALLRLMLKRSLLDELIERIRSLEGPWTGVHVRNTDYTTNFEDLLTKLKHESVKRIFLATDSLKVRERFKSELTNTTVYSLSRRLSSNGKPLQNLGGFENVDVYSSNCDAIFDLLMLALSTRLLFQKIAPNIEGTSHSGFAILAHNLWTNKIFLRHLISDSRIEFGLG
jgi:hypothetical protein